MKKSFDTKKIVTLGMFAAIAFIMMVLSKLSPISVAGFLKYDPKDIAIVICGYIFGPLSSLVVSLVVAILEWPISGTGPIGAIMNIVSSSAFACTAAIIYKKNRTFKGAIIGLAAACILTTSLMGLWNYILTPLYMTDVPAHVVKGMVIPVFIPFNLIKTLLNASFAIILYKPVVGALRKAKLVKADNNSLKHSIKHQLGVWIGVTFVIIASVIGILLLSGII